MSKFGRYQAPEAPSSVLKLHIYDGTTPLKAVSHPPLNGVLDQEDLIAQGINTAQLIKGAREVNALGSCTANAFMSALSRSIGKDDYFNYCKTSSYEDVKMIEEAAIKFYAACTHQTGDPATEWPPTDCGSSGPYVVEEAERQKLISNERIASGAQHLCSLLQTGIVLLGSPWFNSFMEPDNSGFIDGDGSVGAIQQAIASGVAGGHETAWWQIEKIALTETGHVIPEKTIGVGRNSWTKSWGDAGCYRFHFSTFNVLGGSCDFRQLVGGVTLLPE